MPAPSHTYGQSTVTAVQLTPAYPSDSAFPSDFAYPDTTWAVVGPLDATLAPRVNDAHLSATSFGGAALTPTAALIQLT